MKFIKTESQLVQILNTFFISNEFQTVLEVPNLGQSVDLVAIKKNNLTFVEAKMSNWRRAIVQCKAHIFAADYIYIGISSNSISKNFLSISRDLGFGIIHVNPSTGECKIFLKPKCLKKSNWMPIRNIVKSKLEVLQNEY